MVAGLLFLALAFFAVGQAGATRNGAQSGADAAALAAAQESRDHFRGFLKGKLLDLDFLRDLFNGDRIGTYDGCGTAGRLALRNGTELKNCDRAKDGRWGFTVRVVSQKPVGDTILPGTEDDYARAEATAVVEPLCTLKPREDEGKPGSGDGQEDEPDKGKPSSPGRLVCDGDDWDIDPENPDQLPELSHLFSVRLAED